MQEKRIYLVGAAVRDTLMGRAAGDKAYVAVGYAPADFAHLEQVEGTYPYFVREDGSTLTPAGPGESIEAVLLQQGLTIDAIAYEEQEERYVDPCNGREDIEKRILRHTSETFAQAPLNVLRLARLRATFGTGWNIHASTRVLIYGMREALTQLPPEQVWDEVQQVLALPDTHLFFETLFELGVLDAVFPSLFALTTFKEGTKYHREASLFAHVMMVLRELKHETPLLKLTALYHDIAKPYCFRTYGNGTHHGDPDKIAPRIDMAIPEAIKAQILFLSEMHTKLPKLPQMSIYHITDFFERFDKDEMLLEALIRFKRADDQGRFTDVPRPAIWDRAILKTFDAITAYDPAKWIASQAEKPDDKAIALHMHLHNVEVVKRTFFA
ncbi:polynucleotide adenylyltransferase [Sulfurimonas sp. HSL-3221]|uniref:polynucleotide adenylyltransferase n=1 Tax=Sulfurimonadaceae TaxID=2771471 RepID=UPI001E4EE35E|nr:polynucleotide adenylyltransferase [Sulfurimonas sp. HSL-3221]UFS61721.1 polynucleotide adenylyltransferase [Sulfurimonas sp. HSL-3221]